MKTDTYAALSGAQAAWRQLEIISNNLANASTTGFRESRMSFESASGALTQVGAVKASTVDGALITDGDPAHLALRGDAFFSLGDGTYTRDGNFRVDGDGALVTADGALVLNESGSPFVFERGESFTVGPDGMVTGTTSGEKGRLGLAVLPTATPLGNNRWSGTGTPAELGVTVVQGALEASNADPMRGMVDLIEASRFFESQQKAMQTSDEMRQRLNRIGGS